MVRFPSSGCTEPKPFEDTITAMLHPQSQGLTAPPHSRPMKHFEVQLWHDCHGASSALRVFYLPGIVYGVMEWNLCWRN